MNDISPAAKAARDAARRANGEFGKQQHSEPDSVIPGEITTMSPADIDAHLVDALAHHDPEAVERRLERIRVEYDRRGGWPRAFIVPGGHVHSSTSCPTCNKNGKPTPFVLLPAMSGADEQEVVAAAGDRACTVCYPTAPVDALARPSTLEHPDEAAARQAREARDRKRAETAARRARTELLEPVSLSSPYDDEAAVEEVRTVPAAKAALGDDLITLYTMLQRYEDDPSDTEALFTAVRIGERTAVLLEALAAKNGTTVDAELAHHHQRMLRTKDDRRIIARTLAGRPLIGTDLAWPDAH